MQDVIRLFHGITKMIIVKLIYIKLINNKHKYESKYIAD